MADDVGNYDWGNDPFDGDIDFDSDFDKAEKHGFIRSFATGFLSGVVEKTVGDTDARIDTLKMVLPKTWTRAFNTLDQLNRKRRELTRELQGEIHGSMDDLQYLARRAGERLQKSFPNKIAGGLIEFSKNDYSSWENTGGNRSDTPDSMQTVEEGEVNDVVDQAGANSIAERETAVDVGNAQIGMMAEIGGRTIGGLTVMNQQLVRSNMLLEGILDYQRKVQARNDAMRLTLAARSFLTDSKYYKFQEASNHRIIRELKAIATNSAKSDYEKTTHSQAAKKSIRDSVFTTVKGQFGGVADYFSERFGKSARSDAVGSVGEIASSLRMALEMTEGMDFNFGSMMGNAAAGMFISSLPRLLRTGKAKAALDKLKKRFPEAAKKAEDAYIRLEDLGNVTNYGLANLEGMANTLVDFNKNDFYQDDDMTYEDYLDQHTGEGKPMGKYEWKMKTFARNAVNKGTSAVLDDMYSSTATQYNLQRRTLKDNFEAEVWRRQDSRTLNEAIPALLGAIELSLEKIRTGDDTLKARSYDYVRGKLIDHRQKVSDAFNRTFQQNDFRNYADMALRTSKQLDPNKELTESAANALAMEMAKQADRKKGFSPYNYMELPHLNPNDAAEIRGLMQRNFGITDEIFDEFKEGDHVQRKAKLTYLPTESGRELAAKIIDEAIRLGNFAPDLAGNIDVARNSGYHDLMKEWGMTKTEYGRDRMDEDKVWELFQQFVNDPNKRITRPDPQAEPYRRTRSFGNPFPTPDADVAPIGPKPTPDVTGPDAPDEFQETMKAMKASMDQVAENTKSTLLDGRSTNIGSYVDKLGERIDRTNAQLETLVTLATDRNGTLLKILEAKTVAAEDKLDETESAEVKAEKLSILDRLKQTSFKDIFNKGMDTLLKHEPLVLGGLLGGLAGMAIYNPKAAAIAGGGIAVAMAYGKFRSMALARKAMDDQDLYEEGSDIPILEAWKLRRGDYYDQLTGKAIDTWDAITGAVMDLSNNTVIGAKRLANKLFTEDNKEVFLAGLSKVRDLMVKAFKWFDPVGRIKGMMGKVAERFYQMDVYVEGESEPALYGNRFSKGHYYVKDSDGNFVSISGWNEITGAVYDKNGSVLITEEEYDAGLKTSMGLNINKLGKGAQVAKKWGLDLFNKAKEHAMPWAKKAMDKGKGALKADYTPIVSAVDRIYNLLLSHWGYEGYVPPTDPDAPIPAPVMGPPAPGPFPTPESDITVPVNPEAMDGTPKESEEDLVARRKLLKLRRQTPAPDFVGPMPFKTPTPEGGPEAEPPKPIITPADAPDDAPPRTWIFKRDYDDMKKRFPLMADEVEKYRKRYEDRQKEMNGEEADKPADTNDPDRLNSLADKKNKEYMKKEEEVQDAIIEIAKNFGFGEQRGQEQKERPKGLFAMIGSMIGGIATGIGQLTSFFTSGILWRGLSTLFSFASFGLRTFPKLLTGIGAIGSGIVALIKAGGIGGGPGGVLGGLGGGLGKVGLGLGISSAANAAMEAGYIDKDSGMGQTLDYAGNAVTAIGVGQMGLTALKWMGIGGGGTVGSMAMAGLRALPAVIGGLLSAPVAVGAAIVGGTMYKSWQLVKAMQPRQFLIRMTQYGLSDPNGDLAEKLLQIEEMLTEYVVIGNGKASLSQSAPIDKVVQMLTGTIPDKKGVSDALSWFNGRFKPVFMTYMACLDVVKIKSLKDYDKLRNGDVYRVAKQTHEAISLLVPFPYTITAKVDPENPILERETTIIRVNNYLAELKENSDTADRLAGVEPLAAVETVKGASVEALQQEKVRLETKLRDPNAEFEGWFGRSKAESRLNEVQGEIGKLNEAYKAGTAIAEIFVKDMLPDGRPIDMLTAIRLAAYGNDENIPWRVEAVLKLERYCEQYFKVNGDAAEFTGQIGDLFPQFKDAFRTEPGYAPTWCLWFKDRFLPVLTNYMIQVAKYRKGRPGVVWKSLSVTARYEIAKALVDSKVEVGAGLITSIWYVRAAPFKDGSSPDRSDKVDKMLQILSEASVTARLKDPEMEAGKTNAQTWANAISPHKTGGGFTEKYANTQDASQFKTGADAMRGGQFSTNGSPAGNISGLNGAFKTPENQFGFQPMSGDSSTDHLDMSGVTAQQGKDSGVSVPKKLAEQLVIREMMKQGFTDPRAIAEMLALTNYETGGYKRTVENMKYSTPEQLMKVFKEVRSIDQAKQLIAMGEVEIANTVYGGGKGASLGNKDPGDGYKYRGRGMVQLTGRANYEKYGKELGIDLVNKPELLSTDPNVMAQVAVAFFKNSKLLRGISEDGDFGKAAAGLNGGNALPDMQKRYALYMDYLKQIQEKTLGADDKFLAENSGSQTPTEMYGNTGPSEMKTPASYGGGATGAPAYTGGPAGGGGGAYSGTPQGGSDFANYGTEGNYTNTGAGSGLILKSEETTGGGAHHPGLEALCKIIQSRVPGFNRFTALNDRYHVEKGSKGLHPKGLAADFTLTMGAQGSQRAVAIVTEIMRGAGLSPSEYSVINEYMVKTAIGTGGHIHAGFKTPGAAEKFLQASGGTQPNGQDTTGAGGGMVQPTQQPGGSAPTGEPAAEVPAAQPQVPQQPRTMPTPPPPPVGEPKAPEGVGEPDDEFQGKPNLTGLPLPKDPRGPQPQATPEGYDANQRRNAAAGHDGSVVNDLLSGLKDIVGQNKKSDDEVKQLLAILVKTAQEGNTIAKSSSGGGDKDGYVSMN
jgi:predicted chitinase